MNAKDAALRLLKAVPLKKAILFESNPDFADNTLPVYLELRRELPSWKMVWIVQTPEGEKIRADRSYLKAKKKGADTVIYAHPVSAREKLRRMYYFHRSAAIVFCNHRQKKGVESQLSFFLCHGSKTKKTQGFYEVGGYADYVECQAPFFEEVTAKEYGCRRQQLVTHGYPRCDDFYREEPSEMRRTLLGGQDERYLIWLPTFRKQQTGRTDVRDGCYDALGMPLIYDIKTLKEFDRFLEERGIHILFKPHPSQDLSGLVRENLTHFHILTDEALRGAGLRLYQVIAGADALITDYSSVFFDFLLLNRPVATTTDDIENWKEGRGFAFDLESMYNKATVRVPDLSVLKTFIDGVLSGEDEKADERAAVRDLTNRYSDGNSTKRVCAFIMEKLSERMGKL